MVGKEVSKQECIILEHDLAQKHFNLRLNQKNHVNHARHKKNIDNIIKNASKENKI